MSISVALLRGAARIDHRPPFFFARRCSTAVCLMNSRQRNRRTAAYRLAGGHVAHETALGGDPGSASDMQMAGEPALPSDHDKIIEPRASRRSRPDRRGCNNDRERRCARSAPDYQSSSPSRSPYRARIRDRSWYWRRYRHRRRSETRPSCGTLIGAFGSGANPNPSWPIRTPGCSTTREPIRQWLSVTLARDPAIVADLDPGGDHRVGADPAALAEPHAALDDHIRADIAILRARRPPDR